MNNKIDRSTYRKVMGKRIGRRESELRWVKRTNLYGGKGTSQGRYKMPLYQRGADRWVGINRDNRISPDELLPFCPQYQTDRTLGKKGRRGWVSLGLRRHDQRALIVRKCQTKPSWPESYFSILTLLKLSAEKHRTISDDRIMGQYPGGVYLQGKKESYKF